MAPPDTRLQTHPFGITGVAVSEIERRVGVDEPLPLSVNAQLAVIGKPVPRINGRAKVTGAARFTVDVKLPGMLHGRLLRSPHPHARIRSIDTGTAERLSGVRAVHVITDVVGRPIEIDAGGAAPASVSGRTTLYVGDPIAAVAATTLAAVQAALDLIEVDYQVLPFVVDIEDARRADAPPVFQGPVQGDSFTEMEMSGAGRALVATSAARTRPARAAMSRRASLQPTSLSRANSAPRCKLIVASSRTPWWPIGAPTASPSTYRRNTLPACATSWPSAFGLRAAACG